MAGLALGAKNRLYVCINAGLALGPAVSLRDWSPAPTISHGTARMHEIGAITRGRTLIPAPDCPHDGTRMGVSDIRHEFVSISFSLPHKMGESLLASRRADGPS